jgi:pimeloyl-ACP methyl ester carboxylesterase
MKIHTVQGAGGVKLHVRERGKTAGIPILLIHGWSQSLLAEFRWALAAARRYEDLRYGRARQASRAPADIPRRIFAEFYARPTFERTYAVCAPALCDFT